MTEPAPFSVMVTLVALPPKLLPFTVKGVRPQVLSAVSARVNAGAFIQPHDVANIPVVVTQPAPFLAAR